MGHHRKMAVKGNLRSMAQIRNRLVAWLAGRLGKVIMEYGVFILFLIVYAAIINYLMDMYIQYIGVK